MIKEYILSTRFNLTELLTNIAIKKVILSTCFNLTELLTNIATKTVIMVMLSTCFNSAQQSPSHTAIKKVHIIFSTFSTQSKLPIIKTVAFKLNLKALDMSGKILTCLMYGYLHFLKIRCCFHIVSQYEFEI